MNGESRKYVVPSTVTCFSSMHSSSADWVLGEARLISSPTTMLAKMPPGRNSKWRGSWVYKKKAGAAGGGRGGGERGGRPGRAGEPAPALLWRVCSPPR